MFHIRTNGEGVTITGIINFMSVWALLEETSPSCCRGLICVEPFQCEENANCQLSLLLSYDTVILQKVIFPQQQDEPESMEHNRIQTWSAFRRFNQSCLCVLQVSSLFKDGTIGGNINIVIVGLVLLDEEQVTASKPTVTLRLQAVRDNWRIV